MLRLSDLKFTSSIKNRRLSPTEAEASATWRRLSQSCWMIFDIQVCVYELSSIRSAVVRACRDVWLMSTFHIIGLLMISLLSFRT